MNRTTADAVLIAAAILLVNNNSGSLDRAVDLAMMLAGCVDAQFEEMEKVADRKNREK